MRGSLTWGKDSDECAMQAWLPEESFPVVSTGGNNSTAPPAQAPADQRNARLLGCGAFGAVTLTLAIRLIAGKTR